MTDTLITFPTAKLAKDKGFNTPVRFGVFGSKMKLTENHGWENNKKLELNDWNKKPRKSYSVPTQSLLQKWLREVHDIHIQIRRENYFYKVEEKYFHFDISRGKETDITGQQDLHGNIMDDCGQDIPGNYLNNEKYSKQLFEREFAFHTYESVLEYALTKALNLINE